MSDRDFRLFARVGIFVFLFLAMIVFPTMASLADTPWPKLGGDLNNTGRSSYVGSLTNSVKWTFTTNSTGSGIVGSPVIGADGTIYIGDGGGSFYAISPNGTKKWEYPIGNSAYFVYGAAAIGSDGTIYWAHSGSIGNTFFAFYPNGTLKWAKTTSAVMGSPTIGSDGTIYLGSGTSAIFYAWNPDGTLKWTNTTFTTATSSNGFYDACPVIGPDGVIYAANNDKNIYAFNPDGTKKWSNATVGRTYGLVSRGADGTLYVGNQKLVFNLTAFNSDGTRKWYNKTANFIIGAPAISKDGSTIYVGSANSSAKLLYAINSNDGTIKWSKGVGGAIQGSPVIGADGTIYVGTYDDFSVYAFTSDGTPIWKYTTNSYIQGSPAIGPDGTLYIGSTDKKLYAFEGVVDFSATQINGSAPLSLQFTGTSPLTVAAWQWDFGDGSNENATVQNPVHNYTSPGSYTVNLTITHANGTNYISKSGYINVYSAPVANFTASSTAGPTPLTVTFTDTSTNSPTSWLWNFGDGSNENATVQNPVHTYSTSGTTTTTYTVNLTVTNVAGSNISCKADYIALLSATPVVSFTGSPRVSGEAPQTVQFNDTSTLNPTSWNWSFGDGEWFNTTDSTLRNASHRYTNVGSYTVNLTATNAIGANTSSITGFINILTPAPIAYNRANIYVSNDEGIKYDWNATGLSYTYIPNTYGFSWGSSTGGLNALGIFDGTDETIVQTRNQSGTFWASFGGGQPTMHDGILMLAVNGTIPDDFSVHIKSSGYNWTLDTTPPLSGENAAAPTVYNYVDGAVNETFTKSDFIYGPQSWKPCSSDGYPIYSGENQSDSINQFQIMFIDLRVGAMSSSSLIDTGKIKIEYSFYNLTSFAVFNDYGWYSKSNNGRGIIMTNKVTTSGYQVTGIPGAPIANFTSSTNTSDILSPVQFTDTSANVSQSWFWEFGDGNTSTVQNPTYTYNTSGTYTVNLTVTNIKGTDKIVKTGYITKVISAVPAAGFTANVTSGVSPVPVQFTDKSTGTIFSWSWDFGDGTSSTSQNPIHWYAPGTYSVNLTVRNSGGASSHQEPNYIKVTSNGLANQVMNPGFESGDLTGWTVGDTNAVVSSAYVHSGNYALYTGTSTSLEQYLDLTGISNISFWNYRPVTGYGPVFNLYIDGSLIKSTDDSTNSWIQEIVPVSGYSGIHLVKIAYSDGSTNKPAYLDDVIVSTVSSGSTTPPTASFTATPVNGKAPLTVQFTDTSTDSPTSWSWNFGDGNTSTAKNPTYTYLSPGTYDVSLTAANAGGSNTRTRSGFIYVTSSIGTLPSYSNIFVRTANHDGIKRDTYGNGTYYIPSDSSSSAGLAAIHISTDSTASAGQVTISRNNSGTFYVTDTSGDGYQDEVILLLAVNGTIPDDFSARIKTSGYSWTPSGSAPSSSGKTYESSALDQTFTKKDFFYGPQSWKPTQGTGNYPLMYGENVSDPANQFQLMFIDTRVGVLGTSYSWYDTYTNYGAVKVDYSFTDLPDNAVFNVYGWKKGTGMGWTNALTGSSGTSGYSVISSTIPIPPVTNFTVDQTEGLAPFNAQFTDTSANIPTSWSWDFGDGGTSAVKNPVHAYSAKGTYSVILTASNRGGTNTTTRSSYITVTEPKVSTSEFTLTGVSTTSSGSAQNVSVDSANATTNGNVVTLTNAGTNWSSVAITLTDAPVTNSSGSTTTLEGTVSNVVANITTITVPIASLGNPVVNLSLSMSEVPGDGSSVTTNVTSDPDSDAGSGFSLVATNASKTISDIAYTVTINKTGIANCGDGGIIKSATITMTVSKAWVTTYAGGDTSRVVIMHRCDNCTTTFLTTTFAGTDASGNYVFTALSPTGLSTFVLAAVSPITSTTTGSSISSGGGGVAETGRQSVISTTMPAAKIGDTVTVSFTQALTDSMPIGISSVEIVPNQTIDSTQVTVQDTSTAQVQKLSGRNVAGIEAIEVVNTNPSSIDHAVITFALDGTWMKSYGLTPADIVMLRNHDGAWTELPTKFDHLDGNTYYFTATTPGFSYFAVASRVGSAATATATPTTKATSVPAAAVTTAVPVHTVTAKVTTAQTTSVPVAAMQTSAGAAPSSVLPKGLNSKSAMIGGIAGIVIVITGIVLYRRKKRQSLDPLRPRR